jgi:hypothetical protein
MFSGFDGSIATIALGVFCVAKAVENRDIDSDLPSSGLSKVSRDERFDADVGD